MNRAEQQGLIHGIKVARGCQSIHHLFFVDDSVAFCKAKLSEWQHIQELLVIYEGASGQCLNKQKTSMFFSSNTSRESKEEFLATAGSL